jgi:leader peptidase (prepilin peptidase) / N-methyltransferase
VTRGHHLIVVAVLFAVGAAVGSFLNVCIWRLPRRQSLIRPRSRCPRCDTPIATRDNVPIVGWLLLGGRCRACRLPISIRYPLVELMIGLLFAGDYLLDIALDCRDICDKGMTTELARMLGEPAVLAVLVALAFMAHDATMGDRRWGRSRS